MKTITELLYLATFLILLTGNIVTVRSGEFTPGPGDVLRISLHYPETMVSTETVSPDFTISFLYLSSISVKNLSIEQIQKAITDRLSNGYLRYPVVSVSVEQVRSKRIFIFGEVASPGAYSWTPDLTVLSAVALAGGFTNSSPYEIQIFRPAPDKSKYERFKIPIATLMGEKPGNDVKVTADDVIVISDKAF